MKKQFVYIGSVIILVISVLTFVVFGVGTEVFTALFGKQNQLPPFGKYDGKKIEYVAGSEFANLTSRFAENYKAQGYELNSQSEYYIFSQAFTQTIMNMAFNDAVKKSGYEVPESAVNRQMLPYFYDETGKYSPRLYNQTDESTKNNIREAIAGTLKGTRFTDDLLGSTSTFAGNKLYGLKEAAKETDFIANMGSAKRSFNMAAFSTANFPKEEAIKYAESHRELFVKYDMSAITVEEEKEAKDLLKNLKSEAITFDNALIEKSEKYYTEQNGKLASPYHFQLLSTLKNEEDVALLTALSNGDLSDVIQTQLGYTIFRCDGASVAADLTDEAVGDVVLNYIKTNESGYIENYYADIAKSFKSDALVNGFEAACEKYEITMIDVPAFALNYGDSDLISKIPSSSVTELGNASGNENFFQTAFSLKINDISDPIVVGANVIVLKLTGIQNDTPAEAETVKTNIASIDSNSAMATLMESDKVENNFTSVFFANFMNY